MPANFVAFDQSSGALPLNHPEDKNSWPMKIMGIPGVVITTAAQRVERFLENQLVASLGQIISGTRCAPFESAS